MIVSIHQPNFCPYFGFFNKIVSSDLFVILDDVQVEYGITNRNKIITREGTWDRMKVPITHETKHDDIKDAVINNDENWGEYILKQLSVYEDSKYFKKYKIFLDQTFMTKWKSLYQLNMYIINEILTSQGIKTPIVFSSDLNVEKKGTERIIDICKKVGADEYLSGVGGHNYLNSHLFKDQKLKLTYQEPFAVPYEQIHCNSWVPNLSILDMLFNVDSIIDLVK